MICCVYMPLECLFLTFVCERGVAYIPPLLFFGRRRISLFESVLLSVKFALNYKFMRDVLSILVDKPWKFSLHYNIEQYSYGYFWFNWIREKFSGLPGIIQDNHSIYCVFLKKFAITDSLVWCTMRKQYLYGKFKISWNILK